MMMNGNINLCLNSSHIGISHKRKEVVCQDASGCFLNETNGIYIAAVADGHGDQSCFRSDIGSKYAVDCAIENLKQFAEYGINHSGLFEDLIAEEHRTGRIKQLTDAIVYNWSKEVEKDLAENPITDNEYELAGEFEEIYRKGAYLERIYGTTLIAILKCSDYLLVIQQGDGRCYLLEDDRTFSYPVPEDPRCHGNITTSFSDDDVCSSIRSAVIDLTKRKVLCCIIASDGLENALYVDSVIESVLLDLCDCLESTDDPERRVDYIKTITEKLSNTGNGDDVSIAIVI